jgi:hypothetical protein
MSGSAQQGQQQNQACVTGNAARRAADQQQPSSNRTHVAAAAVGGVAGTATNADKWRLITREDNSEEWQEEMSRIKQQWPGFQEQHKAKLCGVLIGVGSANVDRRHYVVPPSKQQQQQVFATVSALQQRFGPQQDAIPQRPAVANAPLQTQGSKQPMPAPSHPNKRPHQSNTAASWQPRSHASGRDIAMPATGFVAQRLGSGGGPSSSSSPMFRIVHEQHPAPQPLQHSMSTPQPALSAGQHTTSGVAANVSIGQPLRHCASAAAANVVIL